MLNHKPQKTQLPARSCALSVDFDELSNVPAYVRKGVTVVQSGLSITAAPAARPARLIAH